MRKLTTFFSLALPLVYALEAGAQTTVSNLAVLQTLFNQISVRVDSVVSVVGAKNLMLEPRAVTNPSLERLLYTSLAQAVAHDGRALFAFTDSSGAEGEDVVLVQSKIVAYEIFYRKLRRPGWFRRAPLQRTISVAVDFDVHSTPTRRIYFQGVLSATRRDTLTNIVNDLENQALLFTLGTWQKNEKRAAWLEPVFLSAATGAIVYAFYSLRSQ